MTLREMFGKKEEIETKPDDNKIEGKIIHLGSGGWGFITSESLPFTRIFFHWTMLEGDTLRYPDLKKGMRVRFTPQLRNDNSYRAIKISVIESKKNNE